MYHLISHSVYNDLDVFGNEPWSLFNEIGCDGIELLTSYEDTPRTHTPYSLSVHLPYSVDWLAAWEGRPYEMDDFRSLYYMMGRTPEEVLSNISLAIDNATASSPAYGVMHLSNIDLDELMMRRHSLDSRKVIRTFCEIMNRVVSDMPGEEPPFKIMFENLWWPGLRLVDESDFRILDGKLEFDNWGICMDTGHLSSCLPRIHSQQDAIDALLNIYDGYSRDLIDRIGTVHFHFSASSEYRDGFEEIPMDSLPVDDYFKAVYKHVSMIDWHSPFTDPRCAEILDVLQPTYVTHELLGDNMLVDFRTQRALMP